MIQNINSSVSVNLTYDSFKKNTFIKEVIWNKRVYPIVKFGLHHTFKKGNTLFHVFSVSSNTLFFKLVLNSENLHWRLEQIADEY